MVSAAAIVACTLVTAACGMNHAEDTTADFVAALPHAANHPGPRDKALMNPHHPNHLPPQNFHAKKPFAKPVANHNHSAVAAAKKLNTKPSTTIKKTPATLQKKPAGPTLKPKGC
jgi:hypothetical protein